MTPLVIDGLPTVCEVLPDPHMGRVFKTGVPLHRMGDRERSQKVDFDHSLMCGEGEYHVCIGDVFDKFVVPNHILLAVYQSYVDAAAIRPDRHFFILRGNHDASRDATRVSSFDLLALMLRRRNNFTVIRDEPAVHAGGMGFIPFHPFKTSEEMAEIFIKAIEDLHQEGMLKKKLEVIFTHNDIEAFGDKTDNLIQTKMLAPFTDRIVNGHIHIPSEFERDGVEVVVTGSMQPYSHAEDVDSNLYRTLTLEEFGTLRPRDYKDMNLRILLAPGEDMPVDVDCLSLTSKRLVLDEEREQVELDEFLALDLGGLLEMRLAGNPQALRIMEQFKEMSDA